MSDNLEDAGPRELSSTAVWWIVGGGIVAAIAVLVYGFVVAVPDAPGHLQLERNGIRTASVAIAAAIGAGVTLLISARNHVHALAEAARVEQRHRRDVTKAEERQRDQLASEQRRADRLHLTQLFDAAATKLGAEDDATRTAAVLILERLYTDAATLLTGDHVNRQQRDSLQRSIVETICGYVRERSVAHSTLWHQDGHPTHDLTTGLHDDYRSPPSVRSALTILGRLPSVPDAITSFDLTASHLAHVDCTGTYHATVTCEQTHLLSADFHGSTIEGDADFGLATINGTAWFDGATINGYADFGLATINGNAWFRDTTINGDTDFGLATINGNARFDRAKINIDATFTGATINGDASFDRATINGEAGFDDVTINGDASFRDATINVETPFDGATITGDTVLDGARVNRGRF